MGGCTAAIGALVLGGGKVVRCELVIKGRLRMAGGGGFGRLIRPGYVFGPSGPSKAVRRDVLALARTGERTKG